MNKIVSGKMGESLARELLLQKGYQHVASNYRNKVGEIDLIFLHGKYIVFVEVKTRLTDSYGQPEEAVDYKKQRKIIRVSEIFMLNSAYADYQPRYDIVAIMGNNITHFVDAFDCRYS